MKTRLPWLALLLVVVTLFFWKIVFTNRFSPFVDYDNANQAYAWDHFSASEIQSGRLPLWDPYVQGGRTFVGEMQTALFYPLKLAVYLWPLRSGLLSVRLLHWAFVFSHILGAWFMFLLCRELELSDFASFLAAVCFSLGGFTGRVGWPNMLDSAVWLPLVFLALLRALAASELRRRVCWSAVAGLALGMAILAGSLHAALMDTVVVIAATFFSVARNWRRGVLVIAVVGVVAFAAGAVQLLPSMEYSPLSTRVRTTAMPSLPTLQKPPYDELYESFVPHSFLSFLLGGMGAGSLAFSPYFGVLPFLLAVFGTWRNWDRSWVRYLAVLAGLAFLYTLGSFSLLHGLIYTLVPFLWMAPEAGRFIYLTHFSGAILAAFGIEAFFAEPLANAAAMTAFLRVLKWSVIAGLLILIAPALVGKPSTDEWAQFSFLVFAGSAGLLAWIWHGHQGRSGKILVIALILFDLHAFNWTILSRTEAAKQGHDDFGVLMSARGASNFIRSQPGLFRVHSDGDWIPNIGDLYGIQTVEGKAATMLADFQGFWTIPKAADLMNIRFFVLRAKEGPAGVTPVYQDKDWKVLENSATCPRAWLVHDVVVEPTHDGVFARLKDATFDPRRTAVVMEPPSPPPAPGSATEAVTFDVYEPGHMEFHAHAETNAFLVLSEVNYPGWEVTVNGQPAKTQRTDWMLRGLGVAAGDSRIALRYAPRSFEVGAVLTLLAFAGTLLAFVFVARDNLKTNE